MKILAQGSNRLFTNTPSQLLPRQLAPFRIGSLSAALRYHKCHNIEQENLSNAIVRAHARDSSACMKNPLAKKSTANQRKEHNVDKFIQWATTLSLSSCPGITPTMSSIAFSPNLKILITIYANALTILHYRWTSMLVMVWNKTVFTEWYSETFIDFFTERSLWFWWNMFYSETFTFIINF